MPSTPTLPVAVDRAYDLWLWLDARVGDMPAWVRHALGARILDTVLALLDLLLQAAYAPRGGAEQRTALQEANRRVAFLRLLLRGARDRRHLATGQHAWAAERLDEIGRMVGAWLRATTRP